MIIIKKNIMNKKLVLILALVLAASAADLTFNLGATRYTKASDYWTVDIPCSGGSGNYQYSCQLPSGWLILNNQFKIPSSFATNYNFEYVSRCRVKDLQFGNILQRSLAFKCTTTGYVITDHQYFYGQTSYSSGSIGTISGLDVLKRLSNLSGSLLTDTLSLGSLSTILLSGSSNPLAVLPTTNDYDTLIKNGNIVQIVALIHKVVASTIKCDGKIAYLNDFLGRINAALSIKKESVGQLQSLINGIAIQVQKLLAQIQSLKSDQAAIGLVHLKTQLDSLILNLKDAYNQYNVSAGSSKDYEIELNSLKIQQTEIQTNIYQIKSQIDYLTEKLNQLNVDIAGLEKQLEDLKSQRDQVSVQLASISIDWKTKNDRLEWVQSRLIWLATKINDISGNCATLKDAYLKLESDLKTLQDKYNQSSSKSNQIDQQVTSIQVQIDRQNGLVAPFQVKSKTIQQCTDNLNSAIKQILQSINFVQYSCNDCNNVIIDDRDIEPCFKLGTNDWLNYMSKCYNASSSQIQLQIPTITIDIKPITIYSPVFQLNYGSCFSDEIKSKGSQWDSNPSFSLTGDFSCSNGFQSLSSKKGKIRAINNKFVDVDCDDGQQVRLKLGSCSKFEGQGNTFVPKIGHTIHWKGSKNSDATFNLHTCTCY